MTETPEADQSNRLGKDPATIDDEQPADAAVAAALDIDVGTPTDSDSDGDLDGLVDQLAARDVDPVVATLLETLLDRQRDLQATVAEQQATIEDQRETIRDLAATTNDLRDRVSALEADAEKTRDIARSAVAKAEQAAADPDPDQQEDAEELPAGVEPSTSPLDFFANCREQKLKELFVEQSNRQNTYRALKVAKRWPEFGTKRRDGTGVFLTREDVRESLTAELGEKPHRMTVTRVWDKLVELGGDDIEEKTRQIGRRQDPKDILAMDMDTAERLLEKRYIGLDLLDDGELKATSGGVTPVVTGGTGHPA